MGRQKAAKLLLADPERRREGKAPDYVKWPKFHDVPTLGESRMLGKKSLMLPRSWKSHLAILPIPLEEAQGDPTGCRESSLIPLSRKAPAS